jgi:hypothetical protein
MKIRVASAALTLMLLQSVAHAELLQVTASGKVIATSGTLPIAAAVDNRFSLTFLLDTSKSDANGDSITGLYFESISNMVVTIASSSFAIPGVGGARDTLVQNDYPNGAFTTDLLKYDARSDQATDYEAYLGMASDSPPASGGPLANDSLIGPPALGSFLNYFMAFTASGADFNGTVDASVTKITTSPVPLPAAAWLLLSGVGALGAMSRRRRASA